MTRPYTKRPAVDRFAEKFDVVDDGCWIWTAAISTAGYATFSAATNQKRYAHRWIYEELIAPIPAGHEVDHLCFEPRCVNPDHLEAVTKAENLRRMRAGKKTACTHGHPFTETNTYRRPDTGRRQCRVCAHTKYLRHKARAANRPSTLT